MDSSDRYIVSSSSSTLPSKHAHSMTAVGDMLVIALDGTKHEACTWADLCKDTAGWVKIGMTLYYSFGPDIVRLFAENGYRIFLDLKLHDIPHQVEGAAEAIARLGVGMFTVHASGGAQMISAARKGADKGAQDAGVENPLILAVTVLTSTNEQTLRETGIQDNPAAQVIRLARMAIEAGADGIVCSPQEAALVREAVGEDPLIVTPGVRPDWASSDDQSRITTPAQALRNGSTHLVVGRPITASIDPGEAARRIVAEMAEAFA